MHTILERTEGGVAVGFLRKMTLLGTGGLAPIKANSKKERSAKAAEKQLKLQGEALRLQKQGMEAQGGQTLGLTGGPAVPAAPPRAPENTRRMIADELQKLVALRDQGALSEEEFAEQKARLLIPP